MLRHPPRSTRTDTLFPYTTLCRSYAVQVSARTADMLADRGVPVSIGAHGQQQGIAAHWEMWSFVRGGMTPLEALQAATSVPALALGFKDIGTLEPGNLADLVILDAAPLADLRNPHGRTTCREKVW